jgi:hypothetical protein
MKVKVLLSVSALLITAVMLMGGCASTGNLKGPASSESNLVLGRIGLNASKFPANWRCNGEHSRNIVVYIRNTFSGDLYMTKSAGAYGIFTFVDLAPGEYEMISYMKEFGGSHHTTSLGYREQEEKKFTVKRNTVHNLGDISWVIVFQGIAEREHNKTGVESRASGLNECSYEGNHRDVRSWFTSEYPDSSWNDVSWVNMDL